MQFKSASHPHEVNQAVVDPEVLHSECTACSCGAEHEQGIPIGVQPTHPNCEVHFGPWFTQAQTDRHCHQQESLTRGESYCKCL